MTDNLRAALQIIANMCPASCEMTDAHEMAQIAQEALEQQASGPAQETSGYIEALNQCAISAGERVRLQKECDYKQYKIDELMFEYCREEMTEDQLLNYEKHQRRSDAGITIPTLTKRTMIKITDSRLAELFNSVDFSQMVTADDLFYMIARSVEHEALSTIPVLQYGDGTPSNRLNSLLTELGKRFPAEVNPVASDPPEPKYLAAIDALRDISLSKSEQPYAYELTVKTSGTNDVTRKELCYEKPDIQENPHYDYEVRELFTAT
jgi:hypothetical protein